MQSIRTVTTTPSGGKQMQQRHRRELLTDMDRSQLAPAAVSPPPSSVARRRRRAQTPPTPIPAEQQQQQQQQPRPPPPPRPAPTDAAGTKPKRRRIAYKQDTIINLIQANRRTVFPFPRVQHLLNELPVCRFEFPDAETKLEQDDLIAALRHPSSTRRLQLPLFTSVFESHLMREAGSFRIAGRLITFPACRFGAQCVGHASSTGSHAIPELPPVTLMALLFEEELNTLLDTGSVDLRGNRRPCILCYRHLVCDFLFALQPRHAAPMGATCIQIYSNLKDEPGGYQGQFMLDPARTHYSGIVTPIVMFQPQLLRGRFDVEERRWVVDQQAIVWRPPPDAGPPVAGTPLGLFARHGLVHAGLLIFPSTSRGASTRVRTPRSKPLKTWLRGVLHGTQQTLVHRIPLTTPVGLYWTTSAAQRRTELDQLRATCESRFLQPTVGPLATDVNEALMGRHEVQARVIEECLEARLHCDNLILFDRNSVARAQGEHNVPLMYAELLASCIWRPTDNSGPLDAKVISKALPQKCLRRRHEALLAKLAEPQHAETRMVFTRILVVSLLGNYRFVKPRNRPAADDLRADIYELMFDSPRVQYLITRFPYVMNYAVREYIVHLVEMMPAMIPHMKLLFNWEEFRRLAVTHMNHVRQALVVHGVSDAAFESLDAEAFHTAILRMCYQRARRLFREELLGTELCSEAQRPDDACAHAISELLEQRINSGGASMVTSVQLCCAVLRELDLPSPSAAAAVDRILQLEREWHGTVANGAAAATRTVAMKPLGKRGMRAVISQLCETDSLTIGCLYFALQYIKKYSGFSAGCEGVFATAKSVNTTDAMQCATVYELPLHTAAAQMRAISKACGLPEGHVPTEKTGFHFCPVCGTLFNCVIQVSPVMKQAYEFGLRKGVSMDLCDDVFDQGCTVYYCTNTRAIGHIRCGAEPLVNINILGRMIRFRGKAYFICCGDGCGFVAAFCPERCRYTADGYLCVRCSEIYYRRLIQARLQTALGFDVAQGTIKCDLCIGKHITFQQRAYDAFETAAALLMAGSPVATETLSARPNFCNAFVYPAGVILCDQHHRPDLAQYIESHYSPFMTRIDVLRMCKAYTAAKKAHHDKLHAKSNRFALSNARAQNRSGRHFGNGGGGGGN